MNLKQLRISADVSIKQVVDALKVFDTTVYRWESGDTKKFPASSVPKLAALYKVSSEEILDAISETTVREAS